MLVAIAIPIFSGQLEKSRDATSVSNMRAGYAEIMTAVLAGADGTSVTDNNDGTYSVTVAIKSQSSNEWSGVAGELPFTAPDDPGSEGDYTLTLTVDDSGAVTAAAFG